MRVCKVPVMNENDLLELADQIYAAALGLARTHDLCAVDPLFVTSQTLHHLAQEE